MGAASEAERSPGRAPRLAAAAAEESVIAMLVVLVLGVNIVYKISAQYCKPSLHRPGSGERKRDSLLRRGALQRMVAQLDRGKRDIYFCARFLTEERKEA